MSGDVALKAGGVMRSLLGKALSSSTLVVAVDPGKAQNRRQPADRQVPPGRPLVLGDRPGTGQLPVLQPPGLGPPTAKMEACRTGGA